MRFIFFFPSGWLFFCAIRKGNKVESHAREKKGEKDVSEREKGWMEGEGRGAWPFAGG